MSEKRRGRSGVWVVVVDGQGIRFTITGRTPRPGFCHLDHDAVQTNPGYQVYSEGNYICGKTREDQGADGRSKDHTHTRHSLWFSSGIPTKRLGKCNEELHGRCRADTRCMAC